MNNDIKRARPGDLITVLRGQDPEHCMTGILTGIRSERIDVSSVTGGPTYMPGARPTSRSNRGA